MKKRILLVIMALLCSCSLNVQNKILSSTVKIVAIFSGGVLNGTGEYYEENKIISQAHIVSEIFNKAFGKRLGIYVLSKNDSILRPVELVSINEYTDLLILKDSIRHPTVTFSNDYNQGDKVIVVGNPGRVDFTFVETEILGTKYELVFDGSKVVVDHMISLANLDGRIGPGFSGGGVFLRGKMIGSLEKCNFGGGYCLAIPSSELQKEIRRK